MIPDILLILGLTLVLTLLAEAGKWLDEVEQRKLAVTLDGLIVVFLIVAWIGAI